MVGIRIDWTPLIGIVCAGALWIALLRLAAWHGRLRAKSHTDRLLNDRTQ